MTAGKAFFDTNILLYMYGDQDPVKQRRAQEVFGEYAGRDGVFISTQVVQEFYVSSRRLRVTQEEAQIEVDKLLKMPMVRIGRQHIRDAIQIEQRYQVSFWDALILSAAQSSGAEILFTEDLNHGQRYGAVLVQNPFRASC